jgi:threonine dehydratase
MHPSPEISLASIRAAEKRIAGAVLRTPLVRLALPDAPCEVHLKLENLQPIGSFKLRGAANALAQRSAAELANGIDTASAGNMAQGVAWNARRLGLACRVLVPDHAPRAKLDAIERLGGETLPVPFDEWWRALEEGGHAALPGAFVHPVCDDDVIAGNGTIGLEILADLPDVDAVVVPFGGGGLSSGIASAVRALRPEVPVYACEVETAAPLAASLAAGAPRSVDYVASFVDGIGGKGLLEPMWPLVSSLIAGSLVVSLDDVAAAVRLLATRAHVVAEGAGAAAVAAALSGRAGPGKVACVVSGGNIDAAVLAAILRGESPSG